MREVKQGWRVFHCDECSTMWREACRDYQTPSQSQCLDTECEANAFGGVSPAACYADETLPLDELGNLVNSHTVVEREIKYVF